MHLCGWIDEWMDDWIRALNKTLHGTRESLQTDSWSSQSSSFFFSFFFGWAFLFLSNIFISYNQIMKKRIFFFYCRNSLESKQEGRKGCLQICFSDLSMNKKLSLVFRFFPLPSAFVSIFLNFCGRIFLFFFFWIS